MTPELSRRLATIQSVAREKKEAEVGFSEARRWWNTFIGTIVDGAEFEDLSRDKQDMILEWETALRREIK